MQLLQHIGLVMDKAGGGAGINALTTSFSSGTIVSVGGVRYVRVRIHSAVSGGTANVFRLVASFAATDALGAATLEIQGTSQANPSNASAEFSYGSTDDVLLYDLGGVVHLLSIQAKSTGGTGPVAGDLAQATLSFAVED